MSKIIKLNQRSTEKTTKVHILPCHIAYDGVAEVSQHFNPRPDPNDQTASICTFRGRKLCGRTVVLPKGYVGHVFTPTDHDSRFTDRARYEEVAEDDDDEDEKDVWESNEKFSELTIWEHHTLPDSKQDCWIRSIEEWIAMAEVMHAAGYDNAMGSEDSENCTTQTFLPK